MAKKLGVRLCPKPLPKITVQIEPETKNGYQVLVIDDDPSIRLSWEVIQKKLRITKLYTFENLEALQASNINLATLDIAFVDKNIENSRFSCTEMLHYLKTGKVGKIVLASGEDEETLRKDTTLVLADFILGDKIPSSLKPFL